jgi:hypothetical protein
LVLGVLLLASPHLEAAPQAAGNTPPIVFPTVTAYGLDKTKMTLPQDFAGPLNLLVLSFEREQEKEADSWLPLTQQIGQTNPGFHLYLLPIFTHENMLYRWWLNMSLRNSAPSESLWRWTVPLYVNKTEFRRTLEIPSEMDVVVLLTDKSGKVLWRGSGPYSDEKKAALSTVIQNGAGGSGTR